MISYILQNRYTPKSLFQTLDFGSLNAEHPDIYIAVSIRELILTPHFLTDSVEAAKSISAAVVRKAVPVFAIRMGGGKTDAGRRMLTEAAIPTYDVPEQAQRTARSHKKHLSTKPPEPIDGNLRNKITKKKQFVLSIVYDYRKAAP